MTPRLSSSWVLSDDLGGGDEGKILWYCEPSFLWRTASGRTMNKQEQAAQQLFGKVLELPRDQQRAYLDRVCAEQPVLRRIVEDVGPK